MHRLGMACVAGLLGVVGCGGSSNPSAPTTPGPVSGSPGPPGATITLTAAGPSPASVTVSVGQSVTFVNQSNTRRNVASDPHPTHTDCPPINAVGLLDTGQSRNTNAFPAPRTCGFHDHDDPDNPGLRGQIVIVP